MARISFVVDEETVTVTSVNRVLKGNCKRCTRRVIHEASQVCVTLYGLSQIPGEGGLTGEILVRYP